MQTSTPRASPFNRLHFRSVATQVLLVSCTAFCTIGSFNALQGLGGAGQAQPYVANAATAINFGLMGVVCILGGPVVNLLGVKWTLAIGTCGDPLFSAAVYCNTRFGTQWFLIFAAVFRGLCSGLFWAVEGAVVVGYPRERYRGRSITVWVASKELGSVVSSAVNLGLSAKDNHGGHVGYAVYYSTLALMCASLPFTLLLSPTGKVRHSNGAPLAYTTSGAYGAEYRHLARLTRRPDVLLLLPYAWFAYFYYSSAHTFLTVHFSVRARALTSLLTALSSILGSALVSILSDGFPRASGGTRLVALTSLVLVLCAGAWTYFAYVVFHTPRSSTIDWQDPSYATVAMALVLLFLAMQAAQSYLYWTIGHLAGNVRDSSHLSGVVRGVEALGQCVAYGVNSAKVPTDVSVGLNLGFFGIVWLSLVALLFRERNGGSRHWGGSKDDTGSTPQASGPAAEPGVHETARAQDISS